MMRAGFSLFEMSIVLVIISLLTAGGLTIGQNAIKQSKYKATDEKLEELIDALAYFYKLNGRLPCPAPLTAKLGEAAYGREILSGNCYNDPAQPSGTFHPSISGERVRIGALPTRDMMLPDFMMKDEFENRVRYAVYEKLTDATEFASPPTPEDIITINDAKGVSFPGAVAFVLLSHGDDGKGATSFLGYANKLTCTGSQLDVENCDSDAIFNDAPYSANTANFFDDRIRWMTKSSFEAYANSL